jgi:outer membrane protein OmpA-like peptidoglycan-associated protein
MAGNPRLWRIVALAAALALGGCANHIALDELQDTPPSGITPFQQALYQDYTFLARSFGEIGQAGYRAFDLEGSLSVHDTDNDTAALAEAFAEKADGLAHGMIVDPEPGRDNISHGLRDRLVRALVKGRDVVPRDAARAQADYDCWMLNATVASQKNAAERCRRVLDMTLSRLETEVQSKPQAAAPVAAEAAPPAAPAPSAPAPSAPAPSAPAPSAAQQATYTVYFDFDSWSLSGEAMSVLQRAVADARSGGQPKIVVVGHTDTAGKAAYNKALSLKRAEVVREALVDMGARREAIVVSGVGTGDGVREPKNRRSVITLAI